MTNGNNGFEAARIAQQADDAKVTATGYWMDLLLYSGQLIGTVLRIVLGLAGMVFEFILACIAGIISLLQ